MSTAAPAKPKTHSTEDLHQKAAALSEHGQLFARKSERFRMAWKVEGASVLSPDLGGGLRVAFRNVENAELLSVRYGTPEFADFYRLVPEALTEGN